MAVRIGTSGWSYDDWERSVYPKSLAPGQRLAHYATTFATVEIDSTFYRDPAPEVVDGWIEKTCDLPGFEFSLKAPQTLTQDAMTGATPDEVAELTRSWAQRVPAPLAGAGRLGAVLLQLAPSVLLTRETLARLDAALFTLAPMDVAVEFRNRTWHDAEGDRLRPAALSLLDRHKAAAVIVDGPPFPAIVAGSADHAYVRFHGRNRAEWAKPWREDAPGERYDYLYDGDELATWVAPVARLAREKRAVRVFFNNHVDGKAFENARSFERLLEPTGVPLVRAGGPQRRLF